MVLNSKNLLGLNKWLHKIIFSYRRPSVFLFLFFTAFFYFTNAGGYKGGDESFMIAVAKQITYHGRIGFAPNQYDPKNLWGCTKGTDGRYYPKWGIGQSLVEVPFYFIHRLIWRMPSYNETRKHEKSAYWITERLLIFLCPSIISSFGCVLIFWLGLRFGYSERICILLSLIYGLGTMVWPYSKSLMSEATVNVAILAAIYSAVSYVSTRHRPWLVLTGTCIGFAMVTKVMSVFIVPAILIYVFLSAQPKQTLADLIFGFMLPFLLFLYFLLWYNMVRYGSYFHFGYEGRWGQLGFCTPLYVGLWGLFVSPGKSYFLYTPVAILGLISAWKFQKKMRNEAILFLAVIVLYTIPHAMWVLWAGDWAWGPRFLLIITPYMILPAGYFFEAWSKKLLLTRRFVLLLILFSISIQLLGVAIHPFSFILSRWEVVSKLITDPNSFSYLSSYSENAFITFSPLFSHIVGNLWLFKHMIFSYDIWSDVPWHVLGDFKLSTPLWVESNRVIPFWWPVAFLRVSKNWSGWIYFISAANLFMIVWCGFYIKKYLKVEIRDRKK